MNTLRSSFLSTSLLKVLGIVTLLLPGTQSVSQITSLNSDRHSVINARTTALGDAGVADAYDVSVMYWNPAGLSFLTNRSVNMGFAAEKSPAGGQIMTENVSIPLPLVDELCAGVGVTLNHSKHMTDDDGTVIPSFYLCACDFAISYAFDDAFSAGVGTTVRYGESESIRKTAASASAGVYYAPYPGIMYGISCQGLGSGIAYPYDESNIGSTFRTEALSRSLQIGLTLKYPALSTDPILTITLANQKVFGVSGLVYKGGIEYLPIPLVALRGGYWVGPETVAVKFGAGFHIRTVHLDYGLSPSKAEPRHHEVTVSLLF